MYVILWLLSFELLVEGDGAFVKGAFFMGGAFFLLVEGDEAFDIDTHYWVSMSSSLGKFCFVRLPFYPSASWPLSLPSLFLSFSSDLAWFMRECLEGVRPLSYERTFLHSWSVPMKLVFGLLHLTLVLFVSFMTLAVCKDTYLHYFSD